MSSSIRETNSKSSLNHQVTKCPMEMRYESVDDRDWGAELGTTHLQAQAQGTEAGAWFPDQPGTQGKTLFFKKKF